MSERKVLNKYFPPDFDPAAIPRRKQAKDAQHKVRLMTPYAMRCETCGEYIYKGKKFNARKETVEGETYYSIKIFRFYIKCPRCSAEITFKTDPKNTDYIAEHGASRNFEPWREERIAGEEKQLKKELEEENNPMKALENRTLDSKREMDILDALDEIRTRNARNERVDAGALLDKLVEEDELQEKTEEELVEEEDTKVAKAIFRDSVGISVRRAIQEQEPELDQLLSEEARSLSLPDFSTPIVKKRKILDFDTNLGIKKKSYVLENPPEISKTKTAPKSSTNSLVAKPLTNTTDSKSIPITSSLISLLGNYGSDSE
ncbi:hypothetical protein G9A89_008691 [Geosiphon pyriformis]|nr:hypothetical protein G9A89_008691 [Geosiphon pyriformis]